MGKFIVRPIGPGEKSKLPEKGALQTAFISISHDLTRLGIILGARVLDQDSSAHKMLVEMPKGNGKNLRRAVRACGGGAFKVDKVDKKRTSLHGSGVADAGAAPEAVHWSNLGTAANPF